MTDIRRPSPPKLSGITENLHAPEVFASGATSFSIADGNVTINFMSLRWDNSVSPAVQRAVIVQRVVVPVRGARNLATALNTFLESHGITEPGPAGPGQLQ